MIKPDGVKRNLIGDVISRVEKEGFQITKIKMMDISAEHSLEVYPAAILYHSHETTGTTKSNKL